MAQRLVHVLVQEKGVAQVHAATALGRAAAHQKKKKVQQWSGTTRRATMFRTTGEELPLRLQKKEHHHRADNDGKFVRTSVDACDRPSYVVERLGPRLFLKMHRNGKCEVLTSPNSKKPVCLDYVSSGETRWAFENIHRR